MLELEQHLQSLQEQLTLGISLPKKRFRWVTSGSPINTLAKH